MNKPIRDRASGITLRRAVASDAAAIGSVFDAAVSAGWTYLGELAAEPIFRSNDWEQLVADHAAPNLLHGSNANGRVSDPRPSGHVKTMTAPAAWACAPASVSAHIGLPVDGWPTRADDGER